MLTEIEQLERVVGLVPEAAEQHCLLLARLGECGSFPGVGLELRGLVDMVPIGLVFVLDLAKRLQLALFVCLLRLVDLAVNLFLQLNLHVDVLCEGLAVDNGDCVDFVFLVHLVDGLRLLEVLVLARQKLIGLLHLHLIQLAEYRALDLFVVLQLKVDHSLLVVEPLQHVGLRESLHVFRLELRQINVLQQLVGLLHFLEMKAVDLSDRFKAHEGRFLDAQLPREVLPCVCVLQLVYVKRGQVYARARKGVQQVLVSLNGEVGYRDSFLLVRSVRVDMRLIGPAVGRLLLGLAIQQISKGVQLLNYLLV